MLHGPKRTQARAATLRQSMSLPEVLLWQELRKRPSGLRFRRQHPAGRYVLDFYCPRHRLAIEVDGEAHSRGDRPRRDAVRDEWLRAQGVRVCRLAAAEVLADTGTVVRHIIDIAGGDYPSTAFGGPPPPPGED
ncbi:endonuclease domain-containing protein [Sphingomonas kyeonggiensis]|uniref:Very-short-patch-repair endonuclease n=1 Tax=Sphingomonas kyeonggiensis TaxID=1268553 RepID=A0A7W6NYN2_9SPHN|nr:endonuclease domain-containing protein [Sphingomonas kyeonggiensis]MBB4101389.1 very-short-patch-repair endonuclease [Sphingomonas kyeonggiensis]